MEGFETDGYSLTCASDLATNIPDGVLCALLGMLHRFYLDFLGALFLGFDDDVGINL